MSISKFRKGVSDVIPVIAEDESQLRGSLLVAMPSVRGDVFHKSVIYMCTHSPQGAMGIVINQAVPEVTFKELLSQLHLPPGPVPFNPVVHFGGPVEQGRGFILHSTDFLQDDTIRINKKIGITGTVDILRALSEGRGPGKSIFALGYAGWAAGQLDAEIQANNWLSVPADDDLLFNCSLNAKWEAALMKLGITPAALSFEAGHA